MKTWVTVITTKDGPYCVLGPNNKEFIAEAQGKAFVEFMEKESIGGCAYEVKPIVSFEDARDEERRFNTEIAEEDDVCYVGEEDDE